MTSGVNKCRSAGAGPTSPSPGTAFQIAWALRRLLSAPMPPTSRAAIIHALDAIDNARDRTRPGIDPAQLVDCFDVDNVITFSDAWPHWEAAHATLGVPREGEPLDQTLFTGGHPKAAEYFQGIRRLASTNATAIADWLRSSGVRGAAFLDLGAGTGEHAVALLHSGVAASVVCVDYPYVVNQVSHGSPEGMSWYAADLRAGGAYGPPGSIDVLWMSNVMHHYAQADCVRILATCRSLLREDARVVIHEYCVGGGGERGLAAGILGLHFALTTDGGRCYTRDEIRSMVVEALGPCDVEAELGLPISTCLTFRRG